MSIRKTLIFSVLCLMVVFPVLSRADEAIPLGRNLQTLHLGMTPEAFQKAVPSIEMNDLYLDLLPEEQFFKVREEALVEGIVQLTGRFYEKQLLKITVEYDKNWYDDDAWDLLITENIDRYGKVPLEERRIREGMAQIARWEDKVTVYILRRQYRIRVKDNKFTKNATVFISYLDKVLWEKRVKIENRMMF